MSCIFDSSAIFKVIKENVIEVLVKNYTLDTAEKMNSTFYDASYIFYAKERNLQLITEDESLLNKARTYVKTSKLRG
jgi:predicted nucleic acid-binding protein